MSTSTGPFGVPTSPLILDGQPLVPLTPLQQLNAVPTPATAPATPPAIASPADWYSNPTGMEGIETPLAPARPNPTGGTGSNNSVLGPTGNGNPSLWQQAKDAISGVTSPVTSVASFVFSARLIMLVIGIILIAAGLFSFKQSQVIVQGAAKLAGKAARAAAES